MKIDSGIAGTPIVCDKLSWLGLHQIPLAGVIRCEKGF